MGAVDIKGKGALELSGGVLHLKWKPGTYIGSVVCRAALDAIAVMAHGSRLPLLVYLGGATHSAAARTLFPDSSSVSRMAFVGSSPVDRVIAMFRPPRQPAGFPIQYFSSPDEAMAWLLAPADEAGPEPDAG